MALRSHSATSFSGPAVGMAIQNSICSPDLSGGVNMVSDAGALARRFLHVPPPTPPSYLPQNRGCGDGGPGGEDGG